MLPNNVPEKKTNPGLALGLVFIAVGISMLGTNAPTPGGGVVFIILGIVFLIGYLASEKKKTENQPGGFPSEPQARESQAASEQKLHDEATAPDAKSDGPARQTPPVPMYQNETQGSRAASERQLRSEALAPDGKNNYPAQTQQKSSARGFDVHMTANEIDRRRDELKGMLESGIITKEEYRDRLKNLR